MEQLAVLKLFKGYIGEKTDRIRKEALKYALLIPESASDEVYEEAVKLYGKDAEKWNQTFHKSWNKVASADIEQLVYEQLIHYMTTYGFEELGIFSHDAVYIPHEKLAIPELKEDLELISIHAYNKEEVSEKLMVLLGSGIALSKDTISCIIDLKELIDLSRFEQIRNREVRIALFEAMGRVPQDPDEFLRYVIYKASGSTLKIQDEQTISHLQLYSRKELLSLFELYLKDDEDAAMQRLASIFFRNKRLFLAFKTSDKDLKSPAMELLAQVRKQQPDTAEVKKLNHLINRIRKLASKYHQPLPLNKLDRLTAASTQISDEELIKALDTITVYREIRILNGLAYALSGNDSIVYKIRNGRSFACKRNELDQDARELISHRHELLKSHLIKRLKPTLAGKQVCLSEGFNYKAPTSEKQFVGAFPCGSSLEIKREDALIFGIRWLNTDPDELNEDGRVDLDLHMQNLQRSFGWNSAYRSAERDILFSGDMTDAPSPDGASELYYIAEDVDSTFMFTINRYTYSQQNVPFEVAVAKAGGEFKEDQQYMIDPADIIVKFSMEIPGSESMLRLGFVYAYEDKFRVVFDSFSSRKMIVSDNEDPVFVDTFNYLLAYQDASLSLKELLEECGALIKEVPIGDTASIDTDYDLRLSALSKETIISLFA